jgi:hypothetical protein
LQGDGIVGAIRIVGDKLVFDSWGGTVSVTLTSPNRAEVEFKRD